MNAYGHKKCPRHGRISEFYQGKGQWVMVSGDTVDHRSQKKSERARGKFEASQQLHEQE